MLRFCICFVAYTLLGSSIGIGLVELEGQVPTLPYRGPALPSGAARQPPPLPPDTPQQTPALTAADVAAFLDGFVPLQMQRDDIAGVTLAVMLNGKPLVEKGYGYADWKRKIPVDPEATTFRLASISKLFTYTAMLQQVEQGRLNLDVDVRRYLDFTIAPGPPGIGDAPITLRQLATHTAGFEEELHDLGSDQSGRLPLDLRTFLIQNQPHRFARPGTELAYSNYGVALVGYILQRVSGEEFTLYMQRHIFGPLRMTHSSFVQPLPKQYLRSLGYLSTRRPDTGFEGFEETPAGGLSSTAADMMRFGQTLLGGGTLEGVRILQPSSVALFFSPQFAPAPRVTPWNLGFYPETRNGLTFTGHGGDLIAFHSQFWVEPVHQLVFLVSYNSRNAGGVDRTELFDAFVDRYLPGRPSEPKFLKMTRAELLDYAGYYSSSRRADSSKLRLMGPLMARRMQAHREGYLTLSGASDLRGTPLHFVPVGNDTFYNDQQQTSFHFTRDRRGRIDGYVSPSHSDRLRGAMNPLFLRWSGGLAGTVFCCVMYAALFRTGRRLLQKRRPGPRPQPGTRWLPRGLQLAAFACAVVALDAAILLRHTAQATSLYAMSHLDRWLQVQNVLTAIALIFLAWGLVSGMRALTWPVRNITRLKIALVDLSCLWFAWFLVYFHLIGNATRF